MKLTDFRLVMNHRSSDRLYIRPIFIYAPVAFCISPSISISPYLLISPSVHLSVSHFLFISLLALISFFVCTVYRHLFLRLSLSLPVSLSLDQRSSFFASLILCTSFSLHHFFFNPCLLPTPSEALNMPLRPISFYL